ncbi:bifunctional RNA-binding S4 domain superfamily/RNA-binding S4 domain [Babesia duncani]|uniref:Bifunctional RNA-binding S4 domain superfamily/RNA-binding S4 domain n=1 Tax=Babesia duncani TaxID=323732 RepID=A0AAD9UN34_9APIC|nr:bifunctional RNA-binding S4 domain superfamily/RNA-binding S4 domain [Babesia duncani]
MNIRLSSFCALKGICSKFEAKKYIKLGLLKLNNEIITKDQVIDRHAKIELLGRAIDIQQSKISLLFNKPKGYISTYSKHVSFFLNIMNPQDHTQFQAVVNHGQ